MRTIVGRAIRPIALDTFADITEAPLVTIAPGGLTFDGDVTDEQAAAIWARMESRDDNDQARRAALRAAVACCHSCALTTAYTLGDPFPAPPA